MKILSFDTSGEFVSVALHIDGVLSAFELNITRISSSAEILVPIIKKILDEQNISCKDLNYLVLTRGPGSFTGIRVGLSAAQGILVVCHAIIPLAFTSFDLLAYRALKQVGQVDFVVVVIRAYSNELYVKIFPQKGESCDALPLIIDVEVLLIYLESLSNKVLAFIGSGIFEVFKKSPSKNNFLFLPRSANAKHLGELAIRVISEGQIESHYQDIFPLYIKPPTINQQKR